MSLVKFKESLVRLAAQRFLRSESVAREVVEGLFPANGESEIKNLSAAAYDVGGTIFILSQMSMSKPLKCVLVDIETGALFLKEID